jgi:hypothetical protein
MEGPKRIQRGTKRGTNAGNEAIPVDLKESTQLVPRKVPRKVPARAPFRFHKQRANGTLLSEKLSGGQRRSEGERSFVPLAGALQD